SSEESPSKKKPTKAKKDAATKPKPSKKKASVKAYSCKGLTILSEAALSEVAQLKEATKRSKKEFYALHASSLGDRTDLGSGVLDEQHHKITNTDEGTGTKPGVPDVPIYKSKSEQESWGDSEELDDGENDSDDKGDDNDGDDDNDDDDDKNDDGDDKTDNKRTKSGRNKNPEITQCTAAQEEEEDDDYERAHTPPDFVPTYDEEKMDEDEVDEVTKELYK
ncbi:hypothetical protein Tco_0253241, partial [Tanacetum coccineum]